MFVKVPVAFIVWILFNVIPFETDTFFWSIVTLFVVLPVKFVVPLVPEIVLGEFNVPPVIFKVALLFIPFDTFKLSALTLVVPSVRIISAVFTCALKFATPPVILTSSVLVVLLKFALPPDTVVLVVFTTPLKLAVPLFTPISFWVTASLKIAIPAPSTVKTPVFVVVLSSITLLNITNLPSVGLIFKALSLWISTVFPVKVESVMLTSPPLLFVIAVVIFDTVSPLIFNFWLFATVIPEWLPSLLKVCPLPFIVNFALSPPPIAPKSTFTLSSFFILYTLVGTFEETAFSMFINTTSTLPVELLYESKKLSVTSVESIFISSAKSTNAFKSVLSSWTTLILVSISGAKASTTWIFWIYTFLPDVDSSKTFAFIISELLSENFISIDNFKSSFRIRLPKSVVDATLSTTFTPPPFAVREFAPDIEPVEVRVVVPLLSTSLLLEMVLLIVTSPLIFVVPVPVILLWVSPEIKFIVPVLAIPFAEVILLAFVVKVPVTFTPAVSPVLEEVIFPVLLTTPEIVVIPLPEIVPALMRFSDVVPPARFNPPLFVIVELLFKVLLTVTVFSGFIVNILSTVKVFCTIFAFTTTSPFMFVVPAPEILLAKVPSFRFNVPSFEIPFVIFKSDAFTFTVPLLIAILAWVTLLLKLTVPVYVFSVSSSMYVPPIFVVPVGVAASVIVPEKVIDLPSLDCKFTVPWLWISL